MICSRHTAFASRAGPLSIIRMRAKRLLVASFELELRDMSASCRAFNQDFRFGVSAPHDTCWWAAIQRILR